MNLTVTNADPGTLLGVYLNDHLAGAVAGIELARRCRASNAGTRLGDDLSRMIEEIEQDTAALRSIIRRLGFKETRPKQVAAVVAERLGRLKFNGQLRGYSHLSRLLEVEGLCAGVELKLSLWRALDEIRDQHADLGDVDLDGLVQRAVVQRELLEGHRLAAARTAFSAASQSPP